MQNRHIDDVDLPDFIDTRDRATTKQIRVFVGSRLAHRGPRDPIDRLYVHTSHLRSDLVAPNAVLEFIELLAQSTCAASGVFHMQPVRNLHEPLITQMVAHRLVVEGAHGQSKQAALPAGRKLAVGLDKASALSSGHQKPFILNHSFSTCSSPIWR